MQRANKKELPPSSGASTPTTMELQQEPKPEKKAKRKRDRDLPARPLSAYNIFFKEQRVKIIDELNATMKQDEGSNFFRADVSQPVSFKEMTTLVAEKWQQISKDELERYKQLARADLARYRREMAEYEQRKQDADESTEPTPPRARKRSVRESGASPTSFRSLGGEANILPSPFEATAISLEHVRPVGPQSSAAGTAPSVPDPDVTKGSTLPLTQYMSEAGRSAVALPPPPFISEAERWALTTARIPEESKAAAPLFRPESSLGSLRLHEAQLDLVPFLQQQQQQQQQRPQSSSSPFAPWAETNTRAQDDLWRALGWPRRDDRLDSTLLSALNRNLLGRGGLDSSLSDHHQSVMLQLSDLIKQTEALLLQEQEEQLETSLLQRMLSTLQAGHTARRRHQGDLLNPWMPSRTTTEGEATHPWWLRSTSNPFLPPPQPLAPASSTADAWWEQQFVLSQQQQQQQQHAAQLLEDLTTASLSPSTAAAVQERRLSLVSSSVPPLSLGQAYSPHRSPSSISSSSPTTSTSTTIPGGPAWTAALAESEAQRRRELIYAQLLLLRQEENRHGLYSSLLPGPSSWTSSSFLAAEAVRLLPPVAETVAPGASGRVSRRSGTNLDGSWHQPISLDDVVDDDDDDHEHHGDGKAPG